MIAVDVAVGAIVGGRETRSSPFTTRVWVERLIPIDFSMANTSGVFKSLALFGDLDVGTITCLCLCPSAAIGVKINNVLAGAVAVTIGVNGVLLLADFQGVTGLLPLVSTTSITRLVGFAGGMG